VGAEEVRDRLVIRCRGSELLDELLRSEVVAIIKAGGVVKLTQQIVEGAFIAQGQADGKIQARFRGKPATRGQMWDHRGHGALQKLRAGVFRVGWSAKCRRQGNDHSPVRGLNKRRL